MRRFLLVIVCALVFGCAPDHHHPSSSPPPDLSFRARADASLVAVDDRWSELRVRVDNRARWYAWASHLPPPAPTVTSPLKPLPPMSLDGDRFDRLALCESGGDPTATSPDGQFLGAFQFRPPTHRSVGGDGDPRDEPYADQKAAAMRLAEIADPRGQWPKCWPRSA